VVVGAGAQTAAPHFVQNLAPALSDAPQVLQTRVAAGVAETDDEAVGLVIETVLDVIELAGVDDAVGDDEADVTGICTLAGEVGVTITGEVGVLATGLFAGRVSPLSALTTMKSPTPVTLSIVIWISAPSYPFTINAVVPSRLNAISVALPIDLPEVSTTIFPSTSSFRKSFGAEDNLLFRLPHERLKY
jgi:hypothetical protein